MASFPGMTMGMTQGPWMQSAWMRSVIHGTPLRPVRPEWIRPLAKEPKETQSLSGAVPPPTKKYKMGPAVEEDALRKKALGIWSEILRYDLAVSKVGAQMMGEAEVEAEEEVLRLSLRDKRTATLVARAGPIQIYLRWGGGRVWSGPLQRSQCTST
eukprot:3524537-Karenia_brevis.AAC.1